MKTKELIAELNRLDPSGEMEILSAMSASCDAPIPIISVAYKWPDGELTWKEGEHTTTEEVRVIAL